jgi:hypothetical protein
MQGKNRATLLGVHVGSMLLDNREFGEVPCLAAIKTIVTRIARKQLSQVCDNCVLASRNGELAA